MTISTMGMKVSPPPSHSSSANYTLGTREHLPSGQMVSSGWFSVKIAQYLPTRQMLGKFFILPITFPGFAPQVFLWVNHRNTTKFLNLLQFLWFTHQKTWWANSEKSDGQIENLPSICLVGKY